MSNYELHKESIGYSVWYDLDGLRSYLSDLIQDQELCKGMEFYFEIGDMISDVKERINELEKENENE